MAFFRGAADAAARAECARIASETMLPLIRAFPGLAEVELLVPAEADPAMADVVLALRMTYPDRAAMARALASPERAANARATEEMLRRAGDPQVEHMVFETRA
jgi:hypothetical protein